MSMLITWSFNPSIGITAVFGISIQPGECILYVQELGIVAQASRNAFIKSVFFMSREVGELLLLLCIVQFLRS